MKTRTRFRFAVLPVVLSGLLLAGCSDTSSSGGAAVTAGDRTLSVQQFQRELTALRDNPFLGERVNDQSGELNPDAVADQARAALIDLLIAQRFDEAGLTLAPDARARAEAEVVAELDQESNGRGAQVLNSLPTWYQDKLITSTAVSDAVLASYITTDPAAFYAQNKAQLDAQCPSQAVLRFVPAPTAAAASQIEAQLNAGTPYLTVLRQAVGPQPDPSEFDGGCYKAGDSGDPAIDGKLATLAPGQRTVVPVPNGFLVVEAQPATVQTLGPTIARAQRAAAQTAVNAYLQEQVLALRPQIDPRFAVITYTDGENGEVVVSVIAAGSDTRPRIREMPPTTSTTSPFGGLLPGGR